LLPLQPLLRLGLAAAALDLAVRRLRLAALDCAAGKEQDRQ
jgi:hypothetical protein